MKCKSFCLTFSLCLLLLSTAFAEDTDWLTQAEQKVFAQDYSQQPITDRLARLETVIFGQAQSGDVATREAKLQGILAKNTAKMTPSAAPTSGAVGSDTASENQASSVPVEPAVKDGTDYPTVTQLENQVFNQTYTQEDISKRLARLEQQVFHQTYTRLPMVDRVDQLTLKVMPGDPLAVEEKSMTGMPSSSQDFTTGNQPVYSKLGAMEEQVLGKSYGGELIVNRLARLEKVVFGVPQVGSIDDRLNQLSSRLNQSQNVVGRPQVYTPSLGGNSSSSYYSPPSVYIPPSMQQQVPGGVYSQPGFLPPHLNNSQATYNQSLALLEYQIFGHPSNSDNINARLNTLEQQVFGITYPQYSYQQRIDRLLQQSGYRQS